MATRFSEEQVVALKEWDAWLKMLKKVHSQEWGVNVIPLGLVDWTFKSWGTPFLNGLSPYEAFQEMDEAAMSDDSDAS